MYVFYNLVREPTSLTHWGRVTHICVGNSIIISSYNGLSPGQRQAIIWKMVAILSRLQCVKGKDTQTNWCDPKLWVPIMGPPTMLLVPICRDMQRWWDKPPIPSPRNRMPGDTCFDDVGRNCACVTWTQMYVTLQTKKCFPFKSSHYSFFFNPPLCQFFPLLISI